MKSIFVSSVVLLIVAQSAFCATGWHEYLDSLIVEPEGPQQEVLLQRVIDASPDWQEVVRHIESMGFEDREKGKAVLCTTICIDDVKRPWVIYVPSAYDAGVPCPLLVRLHGGVSRKNILEVPERYAEEDEWLPLAEDRSWLVLYPFGQEGATWWDEVGMANIRDLVRTVKSEYNTDDDRVWMAGFSDGASAGFAHAMVAPSDYAAVVALNGHLGVGSIDGDLPLYARNLGNIQVYAVTTDNDPLYPSGKMGVLIEMAREAGGNILYHELEGTHEFDYAEADLPRIARFMECHPRDPFPTSFVWEAAEPRYGLCRWFGIDEITTDEPASWHTDHNAALVDDRVTIGFVDDDSFEGEGVKVGTVLEETAAQEMGLKTDDIIVRGGNMSIGDLDDVAAYKATLTRGDSITLTVRREDQEIPLAGRLPGVSNYYCFKRDRPSGMAQVSFSANRIEVETSRIRAFRILIHPDMIRLDRNLVIEWNGKVVHDARVETDLEFLLRNFLENRDRSLLYVASLRVAASTE